MPSREGAHLNVTREAEDTSVIRFLFVFGEENPTVKRLKQHRVQLSKTLLDDRITGNRRILACYMALWLDAETEEERSLLRGVIQSYIGTERTKWSEDGEAAVKGESTRLEVEASNQMRTIFEQLDKAKEGHAAATRSTISNS